MTLPTTGLVCGAEDVQVAPRETGPSPGHNGNPRIVASGKELVVLWGTGVRRSRPAHG